jgi:hypothetical protein
MAGTQPEPAWIEETRNPLRAGAESPPAARASPSLGCEVWFLHLDLPGWLPHL